MIPLLLSLSLSSLHLSLHVEGRSTGGKYGLECACAVHVCVVVLIIFMFCATVVEILRNIFSFYYML